MIVHLHIGDGQVRDFHWGWLSQSRGLSRKRRSVCFKTFNLGAGKSSLSGNTVFLLLLDASGPQQIEIQALVSSQPLALDLLPGQE